MNLIVPPAETRNGLAMLLLAMAAGIREQLADETPCRLSDECWGVGYELQAQQQDPERWDGMS